MVNICAYSYQDWKGFSCFVLGDQPGMIQLLLSIDPPYALLVKVTRWSLFAVTATCYV